MTLYILLIAVVVIIFTQPTNSTTTTTATTMDDKTSSCPSDIPIIHVFNTIPELSQTLSIQIAKTSQEAIEKRGKFVIAVSGGSLPALIAPGLIQLKDKMNWSKWHVFFADERLVPHTHADSNFKALYDTLLIHIPEIKHVYGIDASLDVVKAAQKYQTEFASLESKFDLILLGMGPDGHTASLFPSHPLLDENRVAVAPISDSPKPPPERITFTYPVLNDAHSVIFVTTGASKADVVAKCAIPKSNIDSIMNALPAARVRPKHGTLEWFMDKDAASKL
jgi:6-phosphogluconolactonase